MQSRETITEGTCGGNKMGLLAHTSNQALKYLQRQFPHKLVLALAFQLSRSGNLLFSLGLFKTEDYFKLY